VSSGREAVGYATKMNREASSQRALECAVRNGHEAIVRMLLDHGVQPNHWAMETVIKNNDEALVHLFLESGMDRNQALCYAADCGSEAIVRVLLENNAGAYNAQEALECATRKGYEAIVRLLLDHGARPDQSALEATLRNNREAILRLFLERGMDESKALCYAADCGHESFVRIVLEKNTNAHNAQKALECATRNGHEKIVQLLLTHGARLDRTALEVALENNHEEIIGLFLDRGMDRNEAMQCATNCKREATVQSLLLKRGIGEPASESSQTNHSPMGV